MIDLEDLKFFQKGRNLDEILSEFGNISGTEILKKFLEEGFIKKEGEYFKLSDSGKKKLKKIMPKERKVDKKLKIFLSYSSLDYELAKEIKSFLESFGLNVFLAHTSIEPSLNWVEEIHKNLNDCDIFIPLLTEAFKDSNWTDQESGIAYDKNKKIFPISISITPYGFIGKFQALRFDNTQKMELLRLMEKLKIIKRLMKDFPTKIRQSFFSSLEKTFTFRMGTTKFRFLNEIEPFTKEEINKIIKESAQNNQIYEANEVKPYLTELIEKYKDKIEPTLKERIKQIIENDRAREMLGGKSEGGFPILFGDAKQKLKQLEGYGGEKIEEMREELKKEIKVEEKKPSLVKGAKDGL